MLVTRKIAVTGAAVLAGVLAGSLWAATIVGTPRSDALRGTAKADRLDGKAGNDKLYGLAGNDVLVGGAGADLLVCGTGRDTAFADLKDSVRKDCELVKGLPKPPPPPPPTPPPSTPPPPPARPRDGAYAGKTSQLEEFTFEVFNSGTAVRSLRFKRNESCEPPNPGGGSSGPSGYITASGPFNVSADGSWGLIGTGQYTGGTGTFTVTIQAKLDTSGTASGTLRVDSVLIGRTCTTGNQTWTAAIP